MSNSPDTQSAKARLREVVGHRLSLLSNERRVEAGLAICRAIREKAFWDSARTVMLFAPMPGEVDIWPLAEAALAQGKQVMLPRFDKSVRAYNVRRIDNLEKDIVVGHWGIREPAGHCAPPLSNVLDLTLVPGVAFDTSGNRLGRGKGYYDRLLSAWRGFSCGVCFDEQIVETIPVESHDVQLNCILTPTRLFQPDRH